MNLIENGDETDGGSCWALKCWSDCLCVEELHIRTVYMLRMSLKAAVF